jgi:predicted transposase YbfD/YdcC
MEQVGAKAAPAVGWALGVERVLELLKEQGKVLAAPACDVYAIIPNAASLPAAIKAIEAMRAAGTSVQMHACAASGAGMGSMKSQFKRADSSGAQSWNEIAEFGKSKLDFFKQRLVGLESIPSHDTFNRFFSIFNPKGFEEIFRNWVREIVGEVKGVVAIDGKLMRGSSKCDAEHTLGQDDFRTWIVSAWSADNSISLGQEKVGEKTNEITVVPKLLSAIDVSNAIVTIDAMGCQTSITEKIIEGKGDYIIALKENQKKSYEFAKDIIYENEYKGNCNVVTKHYSFNEGHGRQEERTCIVVSYGDIMQKMFKNKFIGLRSVVGIISRRSVATSGETSEETRYYITSLSNEDPEKIANAIRQHWSIENNLHWQLDITFREDESKKVKNAARNFSAISKMALSILKNDKTTKGSLNLKRLKAGWDEEYLSKLLEGSAI